MFSWFTAAQRFLPDKSTLTEPIRCIDMVIALHVVCAYNRHMKVIRWNHAKNEQLSRERGVSFEMILVSLAEGGLLDDLVHPNSERYQNQRIMVVRIVNYAYLVPYVENDEEVFLKTIIPSRRATKQYIDRGG